MVRKFILTVIIALGLVFTVSIIPTEAANQQEITYARNLIQGAWQARDGGRLEITARDFGKGSYEIRDVSNDGAYTMVTIAVNGGRNIDTLKFSNDNYNYMMLNNLTTGYSADYNRLQ